MSDSWHSLHVGQVFDKLKTGENGLSQHDAKQRLEKFGLNKIKEGKQKTVFEMVIEQFKEFLVLILIGAAIVSYAVGEVLDAAAIIAIVIINAIIGVVQEFKAEKAMGALKAMTALKAIVIREGKKHEIDAEQIVPGDIIVLEAGMKVPADLRLIEAVNLKIDEALLTGESNPVSKKIEPVAGEKTIADRVNCAFANTLVTYGRGVGIVIETAMQTEFGKIAEKLGQIEEEQTPLQKNLAHLGKQLGLLFVGLVALVFAVGVFTKGFSWHNIMFMFQTAVALAVAAIPEGLPAVVTVTLAVGTLQMAKKNAIVRKMSAVEALGSATVICSDKTGTITRNEMCVEKVYADGKQFVVNGTGYSRAGEILLGERKVDAKKMPGLWKLLEISENCNDAEINEDERKQVEVIGDPTEAALIALAGRAGITTKMQRADEVPFSSDRKMMTTVHKIDGKLVVYTKGALGKILVACDRIYENGKTSKLTQEKRKQLIQVEADFSSKAYRVLAFSFKEISQGREYEKGQTFVGMAAMKDPPRDGVKEAIELCKTAGIRVVMITGDNAITAKAVGERIGMFNTAVITGEELDKLDKKEFAEAVKSHDIFARVDPHHKFDIISTLKDHGHVVAVSGDGVNDAPAVKKADIGISMGIKGTDVTKEASDVVLRDDNFATIVAAVQEGRRIFSNIKSFVRYLLAANVGEVAVIFGSILARLPTVLEPLQLLWINIVTDSLPALALGYEKADKGIMDKKPRDPKEGVLVGSAPYIAIAAIFVLGTTLAAYFYGMQEDVSKGLDLFDDELPNKARTMAFATIVVFELLFAFSSRMIDKTAFELPLFSNKALWLAVSASFLLQVAVVYHGFLQKIFETVPLGLTDWAIVFALASTSFAVPYVARVFKKQA